MLLMFSGTACLFNDSTRLLVLAVESYSSVSLRVNGLRNILGVLSLLHQATQWSAFCQWLVSIFRYCNARCSGNRCVNPAGGPWHKEHQILTLYPLDPRAQEL